MSDRRLIGMNVRQELYAPCQCVPIEYIYCTVFTLIRRYEQSEVPYLIHVKGPSTASEVGGAEGPARGSLRAPGSVESCGIVYLMLALHKPKSAAA